MSGRQNIKSPLIFRLGSVGDTVVALPGFRLIKKAFPAARLSVLTNIPVNNKACALESILQNTGLIDCYIEYPSKSNLFKKMFALRKIIKQNHFDAIIYFNQNRHLFQVWRDFLFFKLCGTKKIIGLPLLQHGFQYQYHTKTQLYESEHKRLVRQLKSLGEINWSDPNLLNLYLTPQEIKTAWNFISKQEFRTSCELPPVMDAAREVNSRLHGRGRIAVLPLEKPPSCKESFAYHETPAKLTDKPLIVCSIGTKLAMKDWGQENWLALIHKLSDKYSNYGLVFIGSHDEYERSEALLNCFNGSKLNLCGKLVVRESAALLTFAKIFIGHDSGPMHLADAVNTPCVAIFSRHAKPGCWFPLGKQHKIIYPAGKSILSISVYEVLQKISDLLKPSKGVIL